MIKVDEYQMRIRDLRKVLEETSAALDIDEQRKKLDELKKEQEKPEVWQDLERSKHIGKEISVLENKLEAFDETANSVEESDAMLQLILEENDESMVDELEQELNYLKTTRSDEVAEQIKIARGFGDLSENSEYDEAKNEQGKLYSRIAELEVILQHVVIVDESAASDTITIGCTVTVQGADGKEASYKIVGSQESDPMHGIISEESPFGKAFLGAKEGQEVVVEAPFGNIRYTVKKIER